MDETFDFRKLDGVGGLDAFGKEEFMPAPPGITQARAVQRVQELLAETFGTTWLVASVATVVVTRGIVHIALTSSGNDIFQRVVIEEPDGTMVLARDALAEKGTQENTGQECRARISQFLFSMSLHIARARMPHKAKEHLLGELAHVFTHCAE